MDVIFNCPHCDQELAVDASGAGTQIECPSCHEEIVIPAGNNRVPADGVPVAPAASGPVNAIASSAAAKVELHLRVPQRKSSDSLIEKALPPLEAAAKDTDKRMRVKTIRHTDCIEVGHDRFDEIVSNFLIKIGEANIISITPLTYSFVDIGSQKILTEFGVMIVYKG
jgi:hypothetical protein